MSASLDEDISSLILAAETEHRLIQVIFTYLGEAAIVVVVVCMVVFTIFTLRCASR